MAGTDVLYPTHPHQSAFILMARVTATMLSIAPLFEEIPFRRWPQRKNRTRQSEAGMRALWWGALTSSSQIVSFPGVSIFTWAASSAPPPHCAPDSLRRPRWSTPAVPPPLAHPRTSRCSVPEGLPQLYRGFRHLPRPASPRPFLVDGVQ